MCGYFDNLKHKNKININKMKGFFDFNIKKSLFSDFNFAGADEGN